MNLSIYNWDLLSKHFSHFSLSSKDLTKILQKQFSEYNLFQVGIVCVESEYMQRLNREYRGKDYVTDVLSFNLDTEPLMGEVYICPEYIFSNTKQELFQEEVIRDIVHGLLHIAGYDHKEKLTKESIDKEEMFILQEKILKEVMKLLN